MNLLIIVIFCLAFYIYIQKASKDFITRITLLCFWGYWTVSLSLSTFNLGGLRPVSMMTYLLLLGAVGCFLLGVNLRQDTYNYDLGFDREYLKTKLDNFARSKIIIVLAILFTVYLSFFFQKAMLVSAIVGKAAIQADMSAEVFGRGIHLTLYQLLLMPLFHISLGILSFVILNFSRRHLLLATCLAGYSLMFTIVSGSKSNFVIAILYFLISFICTKNITRKSFSIKYLVVGVVVSFLALLGISIIEGFRDHGVISFSNQNIGEYLENSLNLITSYSTLPISMFDYALDSNYYEMFGGAQMGRATFAGIDLYISLFLNKILGFDIVTSNDHIIHYLQSTWIPIATDYDSNYAYTGVLYHYLDFGYAGIFVIPFLFGLLYRKCINIFYSYQNAFSYLLLALFFFMMVHSVFTCYLIKNWIYFYVIILYIIIKRTYKVI